MSHLSKIFNKKRIIIYLVFFGMLFALIPTYFSYAQTSCKVNLLWTWTDGKDYSAEEIQPGELKVGDTIYAKAIFKNCNQPGNEAEMAVFWSGDSRNPARESRAIISSSLELKKEIKVAGPDSWEFTADVKNGNDYLISRRSLKITADEGARQPNDPRLRGCTVDLLWTWTDGKDKNAEQSPPGDIKIGATIVAKAQFRNCNQGNNDKVQILAGISGQNPRVIEEKKIDGSFIELKFDMTPTSAGSYYFRGAVLTKLGDELINKASKEVRATATGSGGDCKTYGSDWFLYKCVNGGEECQNTKGEIKPVPGTTDICSGRAGNPGGPPGGSNPGSAYDFKIDPIGPKDFTELVNTIVKWIFNISIPIAVIMIIWGGVQMLIAGDKPDKFKKGATTLKYAVMGLAVIFIGKGFISLIKSILTIGS